MTTGRINQVAAVDLVVATTTTTVYTTIVTTRRSCSSSVGNAIYIYCCSKHIHTRTHAGAGGCVFCLQIYTVPIAYTWCSTNICNVLGQFIRARCRNSSGSSCGSGGSGKLLLSLNNKQTNKRIHTHTRTQTDYCYYFGLWALCHEATLVLSSSSSYHHIYHHITIWNHHDSVNLCDCYPGARDGYKFAKPSRVAANTTYTHSQVCIA